MTPPRRAVRSAVAVAAGVLAWLTLGAAGLLLLKAAWPAYAAATVGKTYSLPMLVARLAVAVLAALTAGAVAGRIGGVRAAWIAGAILTIPSAWIHLALVWADYPAWYHAAYLVPLAPLAAASAGAVSSRRGGHAAPRGSSRTSAARLPRA